MSNVQVVIPSRGGPVPTRGGFNPPAGGDGDDPQRPRRNAPGRAHEKEASESQASKALQAYMKSLQRRCRSRAEREARRTNQPIKQEVKEEDIDDCLITSTRTRE